jgi:hypothetical protein
VYVDDRFVVPGLTSSQQQLVPGALSLDTHIREFVHERLSYRFIITADGTKALTSAAPR